MVTTNDILVYCKDTQDHCRGESFFVNKHVFTSEVGPVELDCILGSDAMHSTE